MAKCKDCANCRLSEGTNGFVCTAGKQSYDIEVDSDCPAYFGTKEDNE
jgi:hypothetical protein